MILTAGDSFATHHTPLPDKSETQLGHSVSELMGKAYDTDICDAGWPGASMDATVYKTIAKIEDNPDVNLVIFYMTSRLRYMYNADKSKILDLGNDFVDNDCFMKFQDEGLLSWLPNDTENEHYKEAFEYYLNTAHYKLFYDYDAYLCLLINFCEMNDIPILFMESWSNMRNTSKVLLNSRSSKIYVPSFGISDWTPDRIGNHVYPEEHAKMFRLIMDTHKEFLDQALCAK